MNAITISVAIAATPSTTIKYEAPVEVPQHIEIIQITRGSPDTTNVAAIIYEMAKKYQINFNDFYNTLWCESQFVPQQSLVKDPSGPNGREDSWGIPQIHLPDHPEITKDQAMDIAWSIDWAARNFKKDPTIWSCYKQLKAK